MKFLIFLLCLLSFSSSFEVKEFEGENVRHHFISNSHLVLFTYIPQCEKCDSEMKLFKSALDSITFTENPAFFTVNCSTAPRLCRKYKVVQQPSVLIIKGDGTSVRYTGQINSPSFTLFLSRNLSIISSNVSPSHLRILFLIVILISLIILFIKTMSNQKVEGQPDTNEEDAPLVNHNVIKSDSEV